MHLFLVALKARFILATLIQAYYYVFNYALVYWMEYWPNTYKSYCNFMQTWLEFQFWLNVGLCLNFDWQMLLFEWYGPFLTYPVYNLAHFGVAAFVCFLLGRRHDSRSQILFILSPRWNKQLYQNKFHLSHLLCFLYLW